MLTSSEAFKDGIAIFDLSKKIAARRTELEATAAAAALAGTPKDEVDIDLQLGEELFGEAIGLGRTIRNDIRS